MVETPILQMKKISKRFPGVQALAEVDFDVLPGEVHALVGQNGAGKSTLLKILAGIYKADSGEIIVDGQKATNWTPRDVLNHGVSFIYQELNLVPDLSVAQNIYLGREPYNSLGIIRWDELNRRAQSALERVNENGIDVRLPLNCLSVAQQQMVAIARALDQNPRLLVLDEPTSRLSREEIEGLFRVLNQMAERGIAIIYVSHRLEEVYRISQRVTVLRDGQRIGTHITKELPPNELITEIIGERVRKITPAQPVSAEAPVCLEVENLIGPKVHGVSFSLRRGELLGIVGAVGAGKTELLRYIFGIDRPIFGKIIVNGEFVNVSSTPVMISKGLALCPEDRKAQGLLLDSPLTINISLTALRSFVWGGWWIKRRQEKLHAENMVQSLRISTPTVEQLARYLSGGNQQKVVLAKWLSTNANLFIFDEPTVGVDVLGRVEIYDLLKQLTEKGAGVILATSDPEEAWQICSRLLVLYEGRIIAELNTQQVSLDDVMFYVMGGKKSA